MNEIGASGALNGPAANRDPDAELRLRARQLEGVFLAQLYRSMRSTVPDDGMFGSSAGEEMFTGMFDDNIAEISATRSDSDLSRALYEQLRQRISG
jgi:flagellar protein FlgJ